jgi:hypothetical protein
LIDAVLSVSRKKDWPTRVRILMAVPHVERRKESIPFVGPERRRNDAASSTDFDRLSA